MTQDTGSGQCADDIERKEMAIVLCGACGRRSFKTGCENIAHADHGPDEPHCPRCGTRLSYKDTKVEHWVKRSEGSESDGAENHTDSLALDEVVEIINDVESDVSSENWTGASREQILAGTCNRIRGRVRSRSLSKGRRSVGTATEQSGGAR